MTFKKIFPVFLLVCLVFGFVIWNLVNNQNEVSENREISTGLTENTAAKPIEMVESSHALMSEEFNVIDEGLSELDKKDIMEWHKNDVLTNEEAISDYVSYSDEALIALSNSGDLKAMKILANRYLKEAGKPENSSQIIELMKKHADLVEKSIVYGDREFFGKMPKLSKATSKIVSPISTNEQKREAVLEALAYMEFMALRGSFGAKYEEHKNLYSIYGISERLTDSDKAAIREKAKEIYDGYEGQRIQLGLGVFDNSVPPGKGKVFKKFRETYLREMGDNAF